MVRQTSEATLKTRAFRAFVNADAAHKKAQAAESAAKAKSEAAFKARQSALEECKRLGVPVA